MPTMSRAEQLLCRSVPWAWWTGSVVLPWALQGVHLFGEVLEVGAGSGSMAEGTLRGDPQVRLTLTDIDPKMVAATEKRLGTRPGVVTGRADATHLEYSDGSFDFVVSYLMLHHVVDWETALTQMRRVLKPGGRLLGYDLTATRLARFIHRADRSPHRMVNPDDLRDGLTDAGFLDVQVRAGWAGHVMRFSARVD